MLSFLNRHNSLDKSRNLLLNKAGVPEEWRNLNLDKYKDFTNYAAKKIEIEDEIRKELFDESDLTKLGKKWGLI